MPQIEARFRAHLEEASFAWLPQPLPSELPHPQAGELETCCSLYLEGLVSNQQQLSELVLSLDTGYQTWYNQQVRRQRPYIAHSDSTPHSACLRHAGMHINWRAGQHNQVAMPKVLCRTLCAAFSLHAAWIT